MSIDLFTIVAQVVNFLILVWLLKRFLYGPILNAIDAREKRIAAELADADAKKAEALKERYEFQQKNEGFDNQREALLTKAIDEVKAERLRLLDAARKESDDLRAKRQASLRAEQRSLSEVLTHQAREEVFSIAGKILSDLAGTTLEERIVDVFLARMHKLKDAEMNEIKSAFTTAASPLLVRTTIELLPASRNKIASAIWESLGKEMQMEFETSPDLVSGIEVSANGHKLAWSIAEYLESMGKSVDFLLKQQASSDIASVTIQGANEDRA